MLVVRRNAAPFAGQWTLPGTAIPGGQEPAATITAFALAELGVTVMGLQLSESIRVADGETEYEVEVYRMGFEGRLRYSSAGPFAETAWATADNLPAPMPSALQSALKRMLTLGVR